MASFAFQNCPPIGKEFITAQNNQENTSKSSPNETVEDGLTLSLLLILAI